jgi:hypothetical protein
MAMDTINNLRIDLINAVEDLEKQIEMLMGNNPIFGLISSKYIKCGKENCKCAQGEKYYHGPYHYLRLEPSYRYSKYLGKRVSGTIIERIEIGRKIKQLKKRKQGIVESLKDLEKL